MTTLYGGIDKKSHMSDWPTVKKKRKPLGPTNGDSGFFFASILDAIFFAFCVGDRFLQSEKQKKKRLRRQFFSEKTNCAVSSL